MRFTQTHPEFVKLVSVISNVTHTKISQLVANWQTSQQAVFTHGLMFQVVKKFGTSC